MRFIVDVMLGRLAKWLRILGYDTLYDAHFSDDDLFFKTHLESRMLLTRDKELAGRVDPNLSLYIKGTDVRQQIHQVVKALNLECDKYIFTRCVVCNREIRPINKRMVKNRVPAYIYETTGQFYFCQMCDKIYWPGSHVKNVKKILTEIRGEVVDER